MGAGPRATGRPAIRWSALVVLTVAVLTVVGPILTACSDGLPDQGTVVGTVVDHTNTPRQSCHVTRTVEGTNPYPFADEAAATDGDGAFRWEMYPGAYLITAVCPAGTRELRGIATVDVSSAADTPVTISVR
ncbi:MAG: hypothetical protein ACR2LI_13755 [Propionibacteriaceae bacterium]